MGFKEPKTAFGNSLLNQKNQDASNKTQHIVRGDERVWRTATIEMVFKADASLLKEWTPIPERWFGLVSRVMDSLLNAPFDKMTVGFLLTENKTDAEANSAAQVLCAVSGLDQCIDDWHVPVDCGTVGL